MKKKLPVRVEQAQIILECGAAELQKLAEAINGVIPESKCKIAYLRFNETKLQFVYRQGECSISYDEE